MWIVYTPCMAAAAACPHYDEPTLPRGPSRALPLLPLTQQLHRLYVQAGTVRQPGQPHLGGADGIAGGTCNAERIHVGTAVFEPPVKRHRVGVEQGGGE